MIHSITGTFQATLVVGSCVGSFTMAKDGRAGSFRACNIHVTVNVNSVHVVSARLNLLSYLLCASPDPQREIRSKKRNI